MTENFKQRIDYKGEIESISSVICKDFNLGDFVSNKVIEAGYEDFNFILKTTQGKYFVKIFASFRSMEECKRLTKVMIKVMNKGINYPKLLKSKQGYLHITDVENVKLRTCVMEFIEGKNFFEMKSKPNIDEIKLLARQATKINSIDMKPKFVYDSWAIPNFLNEFEKKSKYIDSNDLELIKPLREKFENLKIEKLPYCFVHGDIISTNVIKDNNGKLWIIDFSVSNYYPRIQELAILACDLCFDPENKENSKSNFKVALGEYQKTIRLTKGELEVLPTYVKLAHAMHIICASYEKVAKKNNSKENNYFLKHGRNGLRQMSE